MYEHLRAMGGRNKVDLTGKRIGRWTVIKISQKGTRTLPLKWLCICDCGNLKEVSSRSLLSGRSNSCGCLSKDITSRIHKTHGLTGTKTYQVWSRMIRRCTDPKSKDYKYYGARGITVCDRWLKFENFFSDMGEAPKGMEMDRINNDLGYSKENCRYITHQENCRNFRKNRIIEFNGEQRPLCEWAEIYNIPQDRLRNRLDAGWPVEKALTVPANSTRREGAIKGNLKRYEEAA